MSFQLYKSDFQSLLHHNCAITKILCVALWPRVFVVGVYASQRSVSALARCKNGPIKVIQADKTRNDQVDLVARLDALDCISNRQPIQAGVLLVFNDRAGVAFASVEANAHRVPIDCNRRGELLCGFFQTAHPCELSGDRFWCDAQRWGVGRKGGSCRGW